MSLSFINFNISNDLTATLELYKNGFKVPVTPSTIILAKHCHVKVIKINQNLLGNCK